MMGSVASATFKLAPRPSRRRLVGRESETGKGEAGDGLAATVMRVTYCTVCTVWRWARPSRGSSRGSRRLGRSAAIPISS